MFFGSTDALRPATRSLTPFSTSDGFSPFRISTMPETTSSLSSLPTMPRQGIVGKDDNDEVVSGIVLMRKGENPSEVLKGVKDRVAGLNASVLPKNIQIKPFYDLSL